MVVMVVVAGTVRRRRGGRAQAVRMEAGAVAVHQYHGGGKVQRTGGQYAVRGFAVKRLADKESGAVKVVACTM